MKGIIFTEFLEMLEATHGLEFVDDLLEATPLESGGAYTSVGNYPDEEIVRLVGGCAERTGAPVRELLLAFGGHLFGVFAERFGKFVSDAGSSVEFLSLIDDYIHPEVKKLYPDAQPPRFVVESKDLDTIVLLYRSDRCMADVAEGIMSAAIGHFGETFTITREKLAEDGSQVRFSLARTSE